MCKKVFINIWNGAQLNIDKQNIRSSKMFSFKSRMGIVAKKCFASIDQVSDNQHEIITVKCKKVL